MTAGRPPEPIEQQQLKAKGDGRTPGHRKPTEVVHQAGSELVPIKKSRGGGVDKRRLPKVPAHLKQHGKSEWFKLWDTGKNWLRPHEDYRQVEMICRSYDDIDAMTKVIEGPAEGGGGFMIENYAHVMVANPLYAEIAKRQMLILNCLERLGFSPTARRKLGIADLKIATGAAKLLEFEDRVAAKQADDNKPPGFKMDTDGNMQW